MPYVFLVIIILLLIFGRQKHLVVMNYSLFAERLEYPVRFSLVADLHSCKYGKNQEELLNELNHEKPDAVLIAGDFFDDQLPPEPAKVFIEEVAKTWPTFYVTGNHEFRTKQCDAIKDYLRGLGVTVLEGDCCNFTAENGQTVQICGVDSADGIGREEMLEQVRNAASKLTGEYPTVLLAHHPEFIRRYQEIYPFDFVLAGHTHGGQWNVPHLVNGVYAPGQGIFPKYAGGQYTLKNDDEDKPETVLIVSRGLARETTIVPRVFNPPELVTVYLK